MDIEDLFEVFTTKGSIDWQDSTINSVKYEFGYFNIESLLYRIEIGNHLYKGTPVYEIGFSFGTKNENNIVDWSTSKTNVNTPFKVFGIVRQGVLEKINFDEKNIIFFSVLKNLSHKEQENRTAVYIRIAKKIQDTYEYSFFGDGYSFEDSTKTHIAISNIKNIPNEAVIAIQNKLGLK